MAQHQTEDRQGRLPESVSKFIDAVIRKMRYRRKVAAEVRDELTAHFLDELQQHTDETERKAAAREMLADFGDVKLLGILLRRAKKRCRPLWRTVAARTFQTIGVLILCFVLYAIWFASGEPTIRVDYLAMLNDMARPEITDADNAWPEYEAAMELYQPAPSRVSELAGRNFDEREGELRFAELDAENQSRIKQWLAMYGPRWDSLDAQFRAAVSEFYPTGLVPLIHCAETSYVDTENQSYTSVAMFRFDKAIAGLLGRVVYQVSNDVNEAACLEKRLVGDAYMGDFGWAVDANIAAEVQFKQAVEKEMSCGDSVALKTALIAGALRYWIANPHPHEGQDPMSRIYPCEVQAVERWVDSNRQCWEHFVKATARPYCYRQYSFPDSDAGDSQWLLSVQLPDLSQWRHLARLGQLAALLDLHHGDATGALERAVLMARAGRHIVGRKTLIEQLVGMSVTRLAFNTVFDILGSGGLDGDDLQWLTQQVNCLYPDGYPRLDVTAERLTLQDTIQRCFTDGGFGGGHIVGPQMARLGEFWGDSFEATFANLACTGLGMIHARRDDTEALADTVFEFYADASQMTPYERRNSNLSDLDEIVQSRGRVRYALIDMMLPALDRVIVLGYATGTRYEAVRTVAAIQLYRHQKGRYPASLSELDIAVAMDPYSDKPLCYKVTEDGFSLYSVGGNFTDDGGVVEYDRRGGPVTDPYSVESGDAVYWPIPRRRSD